MKENLLTLCRFYKGDDTRQPKGGDDLICWNAERSWISRSLENHEEDVFGLDQYIESGLVDFQKYDGIPITLKSYLLGYLYKLNEGIDIEGFKRFYLKNYS